MLRCTREDKSPASNVTLKHGSTIKRRAQNIAICLAATLFSSKVKNFLCKKKYFLGVVAKLWWLQRLSYADILYLLNNVDAWKVIIIFNIIVIIINHYITNIVA